MIPADEATSICEDILVADELMQRSAAEWPMRSCATLRFALCAMLYLVERRPAMFLEILDEVMKFIQFEMEKRGGGTH